MKKIIFLILFLIVFSIFVMSISKKESFEEKREKVMGELSLSIQEAVKEGKYKCCIEPPCTMCYLGSWIWDDGTCNCDGMIAKGEWDKVCPQCKKGIEEGLCKSTIEKCDPERGENFKSIY